LAQVMDEIGQQVAAILVEPIVGNFGIVLPEPGFLETVHKTAAKAGALVIYDEVITAFRFRYGAIQDELGYRPDITVLGKIIGGGLPISAYGGPAALTDRKSTPLNSSHVKISYAVFCSRKNIVCDGDRERTPSSQILIAGA